MTVRLYMTQRGERPWHVAQVVTGDARRWPELAALYPGRPSVVLSPQAGQLLELPASWTPGQDQAGADSPVAPLVTLRTGQMYRARILLDGFLVSNAPNSLVADTFRKNGFTSVEVFDGKNAWPIDWPADQKALPSGFSSRTIGIQGLWSGTDGKQYDTRARDDVRFLWLEPYGSPQVPAGNTSNPGGYTYPGGLIPPGPAGGHAWARPIMIEAWARQHPKHQLTRAEVQLTQALCAFDGSYGRWKESAAANAHNWGAIQCCLPKAGVCPPGSFLRDDVNVQGGGSGKREPVCFKSYPDDVAGAADAVRHMTTLRPQAWAQLAGGDVQKFAAGLYADRYFGGFVSPKTDPDADRKNVTAYAAALWDKAQAIARDCKEPLAVTRGDTSQPVGKFGGKFPPVPGGSKTPGGPPGKAPGGTPGKTPGGPPVEKASIQFPMAALAAASLAAVLVLRKVRSGRA